MPPARPACTRCRRSKDRLRRTPTSCSSGRRSSATTSPERVGRRSCAASATSPVEAATTYTLTPSIARIEPERVQPGEQITLHVRARGGPRPATSTRSTSTARTSATPAVFFSQGDVTMRIRAPGAAGWHFVDLYPAIYNGKILGPGLPPSATWRSRSTDGGGAAGQTPRPAEARGVMQPTRPRIPVGPARLLGRVLAPNRWWYALAVWLESTPLAYRAFTAFEKRTKGAIFGCRMCGQCTLPSTAYACPMTCPKQLRNGPCGGVARERRLRGLSRLALRVADRLRTGRRSRAERRRPAAPAAADRPAASGAAARG